MPDRNSTARPGDKEMTRVRLSTDNQLAWLRNIRLRGVRGCFVVVLGRYGGILMRPSVSHVSLSIVTAVSVMLEGKVARSMPAHGEVSMFTHQGSIKRWHNSGVDARTTGGR